MLNINLEFHEAICMSSRNSLLLQFMRQIHSWVRRFSDTTLSQPGRAAAASAEHDALLDAISRRDSAESERLARLHMERAMQVRVAMLQDSPHRPSLGGRHRMTTVR